MQINQDEMSIGIQGDMTAQYAEWNDKLERVGGPNYQRGWNEYTIRILEGNPPEKALINFADNWGYNYGGRIAYYGTTPEGVRIARVVVYHD